MTLSNVVFDLDTGHALSAEHLRIAEIINEFDSTLELVRIPPEKQNAFTKPYAIRHNPPGRESYIVFYLSENEVNHRVLARLFAGDNAKQNVLASVEADEAALQLVNYKRQMDADDEARELALWALKARRGSKHKGVRYE